MPRLKPSPPSSSLDWEPLADEGRRRRLWWEIALVLGLSLGQSAVYSVVQLADKLSRGPLSSATSTLNPSRNQREFFDLLYQLLDIVFSLVPVLLAFHLLATFLPWRGEAGRKPWRGMGFDLARPARDAGTGLALAVGIGAGTLALYAAGRALGVTTAIIPAALDAHWWTVPVLVLSGIRHGVLEETLVVGYLFRRLGQLRFSPLWIVLASALLRGSYHLYQGFGPFLGNVVMGLVFGWVYLKWRRVMPLVVAHALLDVGAFVGYDLFGKAIGLG
ncbi:type II CAAX endopeptidase family protein [Arthrobacter sp. Y-9]|uniref:CPBP family intramembrane glutamic endopeptidase n=1 Tax=Arthrobacter sp. Y-9 TaxID=3039385 RepID=UPI00241EC01A|nr:type II CAAX endopeptidase family protein [Arthrobacter sp. Y-9]WFR84997.1 type II CAAX endopeptidase family protein [Arthrobacter sp. Y-9]